MENNIENNIENKFLTPNNNLCDEVLINLRKIIQAIELQSRQIVRKIGLTGPQLIILREIARYKELTVGEIAELVSLKQATVTSILIRLEKKGLLIRNRSTIDKRKVYVNITEEAENLLHRAPSPLHESFVNQFNRLSDWEQTMILCSLQRMVTMMEAKEIEAAPFLETGPID